MLQRHIRQNLGQPAGADPVVPVLGVRTDDIDGEFGRQLAVRIESRLIFGKVFGLTQLADVVIVSRSAGKGGIFIQRNGAGFRQVRDDDAVIEVPKARSFNSRMSGAS